MAQKNIFSKGRGRTVIARYNGLQCVTRYCKNNAAQALVRKLPKSSSFLKEVISYYSVLQQVTMRYKKSQKVGMCTTFNVAKEIFFLKEGEKLLQHVTTSCNALQEVTKTTQHKD